MEKNPLESSAERQGAGFGCPTEAVAVMEEGRDAEGNEEGIERPRRDRRCAGPARDRVEAEKLWRSDRGQKQQHWRAIRWGEAHARLSAVIGRQPRSALSLRDNFFASFLLGWGITIGAGLASYPIDTVRRRMMMTSGEAVKYKSSMDAFNQILKNEGAKSL
ncbi:hypothetical protein HPP92_016998 [Vanilla planifolia]|uniref:ADP/ATP translocase n=1 Tax=Vanilla planifolia TaxID=51239 RepID=A0A835QRD5_VANPL|nr:hypothetical protein HPP92_016998 [Vanilla planifolia]